MSTFPGRLEEIEDVCLDRFTPDCLTASLFFLSHFHYDHMKGLMELMENDNFFRQRPDFFIYASEITVNILKTFYETRSHRFKALDMGMVHIFTLPNTKAKKLCITLLPAGHCPGSVMFLFEYEKRILYTGDIRLRVNEIKKFKALHDETNSVKKIDKIYLDTTFFDKTCLNFPPRDESLQEFLNFARSWLKNPSHYIKFNLSARYSCEHLYIEIARQLKMPIHVTEKDYKLYRCIPEMDNSVTTNPLQTRIHSCNKHLLKGIFCNKINSVPHSKVLNIKPSIKRWTGREFKYGIIESFNSDNFVAYSAHCSYSELIGILQYLRPLDIYPCALPDKPHQQEEMYELIDNVLKDIHKKEECVEELFETDWTLPDSLIVDREVEEDPFANIC